MPRDTTSTDSAARADDADTSRKPAEDTGSRSAGVLAAELLAHVSHYLEAQWDLARLNAWTLAVQLAFLLSASIILVAASITMGIIAITYLMSGLAGGIGAWAGDRLWFGRLICGGGILATMATVIVGVAWRYQRISSRQLKKKYEQREANQRASFGRSATDCAANTDRQHE